MIITTRGLAVKAKESDIQKIEGHFKKMGATIKEIPWLRFKDLDFNFYEISFKTLEVSKFNRLCVDTAKTFTVEKIFIEIKSNRSDFFVLLQNKGFNKYEESDYVDFKHEPKNAIVYMMKDKDYRLNVKRIDKTREADISYFVSLLKRAIEIIT